MLVLRRGSILEIEKIRMTLERMLRRRIWDFV